MSSSAEPDAVESRALPRDRLAHPVSFPLPALLVAQGAVPEGWRELGPPVVVLEIAAVHHPDPEAPTTLRGQLRERVRDLPVSDRFLRLVAQRAPTNVIARELGLSERTVERRLSLLRDRFQVQRTADLSALLAARGWTS